MSSQKRKFELFRRLSELGFTYDEAAALRRIEMTLTRWAERECGDGSDWAIERDEKTNKPFNVYHGDGKARRYAIADREAGALRRLKAIVNARNDRAIEANYDTVPGNQMDSLKVVPFHQGDPRGCALYLVRASDIPAGASLDSCYTRGLAVCA